MNPLRVTAANYRSFERLTLDFPDGCCAVIGENGAGKSSIVNLVDLCLFGPESRSLADYYRDSAVDEDMAIMLEFEHEGADYRVTRIYSPRGRGSSRLDFDVREGKWSPLTREDQKATQALIEETIGLSRETFRASAFLAQGDGAAFTEAQPRDRKRILGEVLGLEIWDELHKQASFDAKVAQGEIERIFGGIEHAEEELEKRAELVEVIETRRRKVEDDGIRVVAAESLHESAKAELEEARVFKAELAGAKADLQTKTNALHELLIRKTELEELLEGVDELPKQRAANEQLAAMRPKAEKMLAQARDAEGKAAEKARLVEEGAKLSEAEISQRKKADELRVKVRDLEENPGRICPLCEQEIDGEARARTIVKLKAEADEHDLEAGTLRDKLAETQRTIDNFPAWVPRLRTADVYENDLRTIAGAESALAAIAEREKRADEYATELARVHARRANAENEKVDATRAVKELEAKVGDIGLLEAAVARVYADVSEARADSERSKQDLAVAMAELERLSKLAAHVEELRSKGREWGEKLELFTLAEQAYGKNGVPALIIENAAIPSIELEATRILTELGTDLRVELRTQREKKTGGISETLDIVIVSPAGERPYETFSGGERTRLNLALRIALARLLAHRRGAESRLLVIDEPEFLDEAGVSKLADVLQGMSSDFDKILLISHVPALATSFDQVLNVVRDDDGSRIASTFPAEGAEVYA